VVSPSKKILLENAQDKEFHSLPAESPSCPSGVYIENSYSSNQFFLENFSLKFFNWVSLI